MEAPSNERPYYFNRCLIDRASISFGVSAKALFYATMHPMTEEQYLGAAILGMVAVAIIAFLYVQSVQW